MEKLLILGAGGLGRMVGELCVQSGWQVNYLDDGAHAGVIGRCADYTVLRNGYAYALAAFGDNRLRLQWTERLLEAGYQVPTIVHPSAIISPTATLGAGTLVLQGALVNTACTLGRACLVNSGAIIDHDTVLEDGAHANLHTTVKASCHLPVCHRTEAGEVVYSTRRAIEGVNNVHLEDALFAFKLGHTASYVKPFGSGHINETYAVYVGSEGAEQLGYVIQRINTAVFKNPHAVMENIFGVTEYLRAAILKRGGDAERETLNYLKTANGQTYFEDAQGSPWRCYHFIADSVCVDGVPKAQDLYYAGKSFGGFLRALEDYPADTLHETIENFHDTRVRYAAFLRALERDVKNRARFCTQEITFVQQHKADCSVLMEQLENGTLPLRVTHNDTKLNNILFDSNTGEGLCVIDLDTIMPGLALNDYGDAIRFGASTAKEDEPDVSRVHLSTELFEAYTKGYLEAAGSALTAAEKQYLLWGAKLMTLECGIRFLTDYLQGDTYFKVSHAEQNLHRARTQFKLVQEMESLWPTLTAVIEKYI